MAVCERGLVDPCVGLAALLTKQKPTIAGRCRLTLADYAREIVVSGLPGIRDLPERSRRLQLNSYLTRALSRDLADEQNVTVRRPHSLHAWLTAYAAATASTATWDRSGRLPPRETRTRRAR